MELRGVSFVDAASSPRSLWGETRRGRRVYWMATALLRIAVGIDCNRLVTGVWQVARMFSHHNRNHNRNRNRNNREKRGMRGKGNAIQQDFTVTRLNQDYDYDYD